MASALGCVSCCARHSPVRVGVASRAPNRPESAQRIYHTHLDREDRCTSPLLSGQRPSVVARADSSVPLHLRTTHSTPKDGLKKAELPPLLKRILAGLVMGAIGATIVVQGGVLYLCFIEFFVCQAALEYFGFVFAVDKKEGSAETPQWVVNLVTVCCMALPLYSFVTGGKIAIALALCSFVLLSALGAGLSKPRMSTLSSAMFGLLYCGVFLPAALHHYAALATIFHSCNDCFMIGADVLSTLHASYIGFAGHQWHAT